MMTDQEAWQAVCHMATKGKVAVNSGNGWHSCDFTARGGKESNGICVENQSMAAAVWQVYTQFKKTFPGDSQ